MFHSLYCRLQHNSHVTSQETESKKKEEESEVKREREEEEEEVKLKREWVRRRKREGRGREIMEKTTRSMEKPFDNKTSSSTTDDSFSNIH